MAYDDIDRFLDEEPGQVAPSLSRPAPAAPRTSRDRDDIDRFLDEDGSDDIDRFLDDGAPDQGVVLPSIKRAAGQMVESAGTTLEDITGENAVTRGLRDFGGGVVKANPSEINSFGDVLDKPWTTVKEAVAEQVPQLGAAFTGARLGAMAGGLLGPVGAAVGAVSGGLLPIFVGEYGEVRDKQEETGEENIPLAIGAVGAATVLERVGLEKFATKVGAKGFGEALGAIPEGVGRLRYAGQQGLKTALIEGPGTEIPQTAIERFGGGQDIGSAEAFDEYAVAGAKGAAGGGVIGGGLGLVAPREQPANQAPQGRPPAPAAADPVADAAVPGQAPGGVGIQDLDPAAQQHMQDILAGGPPLQPPPPAGPLGRAAAAGGITQAAPEAAVAAVQAQADAIVPTPLPNFQLAKEERPAPRKRGPLSPLGAEMAESQGAGTPLLGAPRMQQAKADPGYQHAGAEVAAEQVRMADPGYQHKPAPANPVYKHYGAGAGGAGSAAQPSQSSTPSTPSTPFNPPELRFHKLNAPRTEVNARKFAEGLAGRFPKYVFEAVPHRLAKNKFAVKVSPGERQSPPDIQAQAAHQAATSPLNDLPEPTDPQKDAGNFRKGHVRYAGLDISIENPEGSKRSGVGQDGTPWEVEMQGAHYGYIRRSERKDGEQVDVYLASDASSARPAGPPSAPASFAGARVLAPGPGFREDTPVFVVDQIDPKTGKFNEHKIVLGAASREEAEAIYDTAFSDESGPSRRQAVTELPIEGF